MTKSISIQQVLLQQLHIPSILLSQYKKLGLNETEVMVILQIHRFLQEKNDFPTPAELSSYLTIQEKECSNILRRLIQNSFLKIEQINNENNQISEIYSLDPLWEKLFDENETENEEAENIGTIFILFEQEFGRPLSPFEIEIINSWLDDDQISPALIKAGLRESVLMGKLNFNYIDRILRDWKRKGIQTVEDARKSSRAFREHQKQRTVNQVDKPKVDQTIYYNWLEGEDT